MKPLLFILLSTLLAAGCSSGGSFDPPPPPPPPRLPAAIAAVTPQNQTAVAGQSIPVAARVSAADGGPVVNVTVTFAVTAGGGGVTPTSAPTDAAGQATATWTLGSGAGNNTLTATVGALTPLQFGTAGVAGPAAAMMIAAGAGQSSTVGVPVPIPPAVIVKDANGNPVAGVAVTFAVASGGGGIVGESQTTNTLGLATVGAWVLSNTTGPGSLTASAAGLTPVTISATGVADAPATVTASAGSGQTEMVGLALPVRPAVLVKDRFGNPVGGVSVVFSVTGGGGQLSGGTASTNAQGIAAAGTWTLGNVVGPQTVTASLSGLLPVTFGATALSRPSLRIEVVGWGNARDPDGFTVTAGQATAQLPWNGTTTFEGLQPSSLPVALTGVAEHCSPDAGPKVATLVAGRTDTVRIAVGCFGDFTFHEFLPNNQVRIRYLDTLGAIVPLAEAPGRQLVQEWSPSGDRIVYTTTERGPGPSGAQGLDIATVSRSGGAPTWIATSPEDDVVPRWSPDGTRLVYVSNAIRVVNADGTGDRLLLTGGGDPAWIQAGAAIAFGCTQFDPLGGVCRIPSGGGSVGPIVPAMNDVVWVTASPQGDWISFVASPDGTQSVWTVPVAGGGPIPVAPGLTSYNAVWAPGGNRLAISTLEGSTFAIRTVDKTGANLSANLVPFAAYLGGGPSWFPDGNWLAVSAVNSFGGQYIFVLRADGSGVRQVTFGPFPQFMVHVRPTSRFIPPPPWAAVGAAR